MKPYMTVHEIHMRRDLSKPMEIIPAGRPLLLSDEHSTSLLAGHSIRKPTTAELKEHADVFGASEAKPAKAAAKTGAKTGAKAETKTDAGEDGKSNAGEGDGQNLV